LIFRQGAYYSTAYLVTFIVMVVAWSREYTVLKRIESAELSRKLFYTSGIFSFSYIVRTVVNFIALVDGPALTKLQTNSCINQTDGWAILVFCTHFFGEIFPLFVLFSMELKLTKSNRNITETEEELNSEDGLPFTSERFGIVGDTLVQRPTVTFNEDDEDSPERMPGSREKSSMVDSFQMRDSVTHA
jgi:hypothetical protein